MVKDPINFGKGIVSNSQATTKSDHESNQSSIQTNPNSIYRKYYNQNLKFFLWAIQREEPPYIIKLHIETKKQGEVTRPMVIDAIKR